MKIDKISIITAIIILAITIIAFLIIYRDFKQMPEFKGVFVFLEGVKFI